MVVNELPKLNILSDINKGFKDIFQILFFLISFPILWLLSNFLIKIIENKTKKKFGKIHKIIFKLVFIIFINSLFNI